jgi:hypothetical protein
LIACSTVVVTTFSSNRPSIHGWDIVLFAHSFVGFDFLLR